MTALILCYIRYYIVIMVVYYVMKYLYIME